MRSVEKREKLLHQLLVTLSTFDIIGSIAYALTTLPIPEDDVIPIFGARGNDATCTGMLDSSCMRYASAMYFILLTNPLSHWQPKDSSFALVRYPALQTYHWPSTTYWLSSMAKMKDELKQKRLLFILCPSCCRIFVCTCW